MGDVVAFIEEYERSYGAYHPVFHRGSYAQVILLHSMKGFSSLVYQALEVAKRELRFLLVCSSYIVAESTLFVGALC